MLLLPQRYKFSSKSQLYGVIAPESASCCCYRKGTNFQANHNKQSTHSCVDKVVVATAKVQIFKQITTTCAEDFLRNTLLLLPQRYKFSSKSQQVCNVAKGSCSCCCYRKGTNFQANHNVFHCFPCPSALLLLPQRYKFSSKSQPGQTYIIVFFVVVATAKVQIFKQITTYHDLKITHRELLLLPQRYKFSSKSQLLALSNSRTPVVVATAKVQIFKQITTDDDAYITTLMLLLLPQRYKFSSKSQRHSNPNTAGKVVVATAKVQIFKQITTFLWILASRPVLLLLPQRYKFSSKSQLFEDLPNELPSCCCYRKGTNFQANHNGKTYTIMQVLVVVATAKVQIFKQITTKALTLEEPPGCCCYRKGTNFQANHNTHRGIA